MHPAPRGLVEVGHSTEALGRTVQSLQIPSITGEMFGRERGPSSSVVKRGCYGCLAITVYKRASTSMSLCAVICCLSSFSWSCLFVSSELQLRLL